MKQRQSYLEEMEQVLGWYSVESDVVMAHPRDLGAAFENAVSMHEGMHKLLTTGTLYGAFERGMVAMAKDFPKSHFIHQVPAKLIELSWAVQEGTASYIELCYCALNGIDPHHHKQSFPDDYAAAVAPIVDAIGIPVPPIASYQWLFAIHVGKLVLNGPVLEELGLPEKLTPERLEAFARERSPDLRFATMWRIVKERGGLAPILQPYSDEMVKEWRRNRAGPPPMTRWKSFEIFDVGESERRAAGRAIPDHAELAHWKIAAALFPSIPMAVTPEAMQQALNAFARAWSNVSSVAARQKEVKFTPAEEARLFRRQYVAHARLDAQLPEKSLDDLRGFLSAQAAKRRKTLVSFVGTTSKQFGVWAAATEGTGLHLEARDVWLAAMSITDVMDIVPLRSENESYGRNTLWHVPIHLTVDFDVPNVGLGLHGVVLRSLTFFDDHVLRDQAKEWLDDGRAVRILPVTLTDLHLQAIVTEAFGGHGPYSLRSANLPTYCAMLGNAREAWQAFAALGGVEEESGGSRSLFRRRKEPPLRYAGEVDPKHGQDLILLLHMAYNLDVLAHMLTPGLRFVPRELNRSRNDEDEQ